MNYEFKKILVIQQKMIGDVLTSTILLEALRKKYPKAELHYLVNSHTVPVVENNPFIDELVLFTPEMEKSKWKFFCFLKGISKETYDVVIDVYGKISSNLISVFSRAPISISYHKRHTAFIYTNTVQRKTKPAHGAALAIENRMKLLEPLGIKFDHRRPKIYLAQEEIQEAKEFLEKSGMDMDRAIYMISVLGSSPKKTYPAAYMADLLDKVVETNESAQILFNYTPVQREKAKAIFDQCRSKTKKNIHFEVYATSLRKFIAVTYHCDALLGNEGGAANMARAVGIPTFVIFCPFINKYNWSGEKDTKNHCAVHLSDYVDMTSTDLRMAKKDPETFYLKLMPNMIFPELHSFLRTLHEMFRNDNQTKD